MLSHDREYTGSTCDDGLTWPLIADMVSDSMTVVGYNYSETGLMKDWPLEDFQEKRKRIL